MGKVSVPIPSVDEVLRGESGRVIIARYGHQAAVSAVRAALDILRAANGLAATHRSVGREDTAAAIAARAAEALGVSRKRAYARALVLKGRT